MKKFSLSILILLMSSLMAFTYGQVDVTFQVDMSVVGANPDGVTVAGDFQDDVIGESYTDWTPGEIFLTEGDPGIYSVTVQLPAGTYYFKYVNGLAWGNDETVPGECAVGDNRELVVGTDPVELDLVCYGSCVACAEPFEVTFQVDMSEYGGTFTTPEVNGTFNNWCGACFPLEDPDDDNIWTGTTLLYPGFYEYKFAHDNWSGEENLTPGSPCTVTNSGFTNRALEVTEDVTLPVVCWESCEACGVVIEPVDVTFSVDMNQYDGTFTNVYLSGEMNGWNGIADQMLDPDMDGVYEVTLQLLPNDYEYKFTIDDWSDQEFFMEGQICTVSAFGYTNRYVEVTDATTLPVVCWESCYSCDERVNVTLQVDMNNEEVSENGVHVAGNFQGWNPGSTQLTDVGNGVYTYSMDVDPNLQLVYIFINGNDWDFQESVPGECGLDNGFGGFNRFLNVPEHDVILDPVCFASCGPCNSPTEELFISEYCEGSNSNKYIEIYNGTGTDVDLTPYVIKVGSNGDPYGSYTEDLEGTILNGDVFVIANSSAWDEIKVEADIFSTVTYYNGDDAIGLFKDETLIDVVGEEGVDPGSAWDVAGENNATGEHTIVRKVDVCSPNTNWALSAGTNADNSEWMVHPQNTFNYLGFHSHICGGTEIAETPAFSVPGDLYFAAIDVEITCSTPNAVIYYTIDGTDPDQSSMVYTGSIALSEDTEIKAIAYAPGYGASFVAAASYDFEEATFVANLAELRDAYGVKDGIYVVDAEVILTYQQSYRGQRYIQDATAGVLIDDPSGVITTTYDLYDGITGMAGTLSTYGGMLQFTPAKDPGPATSTGNTIVPEVITINDMLNNFEEYEAELVQILDVTFEDAGEVFSNGNVYPISDGSKAEGLFRTTFYDQDYIGEAIPPIAIDVIGICNSRSDGEYISSRSGDLVLPDYIVLTSPNGGEQIESNSSLDITWESNLEDGTLVDVYLYENDGKTDEILAEDLLIETGMYTWNVTQPIGDNYKVKLIVNDPVLEDMSDDFFSIVPPIDIKITEIMYNSPESGSDTLEFVEFYNNGEGIVNLMDWEMTQGADFVFPEHFLNPGEYVVVCVDADAFMNTFGLEVYEWESGGLSNGGEDIELTDNAGIVRAYVDYDDGGNWPGAPDGFGPSLEFCDPSLDNEDPLNWTSSTQFVAINADGAGIYATPMAGCNQDPVLSMFYSWGWSAISSYLTPAEPALESMFAPVNSMVILLNNQGIYWPEFNVNTLGVWDNYSGYKVKFDGSTYMVYSGTPVESQEYNFVPGTFFVPVLSDGPVAVDNVVVPLGGAVEFMFDIENGTVYWPDGLIVPGVQGALETLEPGYAYLAKFNTTGVMDFGAVPPKAAPQEAIVIDNTTTWNDVLISGEQHIISIAEAALTELETGDFIGAFNSQGVCVGLTQYNGDRNALPMIVYGDDMTTDETDGMVEGEAISFRIYRYGEEIDAQAVYNFSMQNHDGLFAENGLSMIEAFKLGATGIGDQSQAYSIYPNPGNGEFNIDVVGEYNVTVTNAQGQVIYVDRISGNAMINLSDQSEGIYFIRLTGESSSMIEKVIVK